MVFTSTYLRPNQAVCACACECAVVRVFLRFRCPKHTGNAVRNYLPCLKMKHTQPHTHTYRRFHSLQDHFYVIQWWISFCGPIFQYNFLFCFLKIILNHLCLKKQHFKKSRNLQNI